MAEADRRRWEARYTEGDAPVHGTVNRWLAHQPAVFRRFEQNSPAPQALDIACGAGGTLLWLAQRGWRVTGVDISPAALALAQGLLATAGMAARATLIEADLDNWRPAAASCDLLTCFYFLDRRLWPSMREAVRPQGVICLSTFHTGRLAERPDTDPTHLLEPGELASLVSSWGWTVLAAETGVQMESVAGQKV